MTGLDLLLRNYIYTEDIPLEGRLANVIYLVGIAAAFIAAFTRTLMGAHIFVIIVIWLMLFSIIGLMYISNHFRLYTVCRWIMVIVLCDVLFPVAYFVLGGPESAMSGFFIMSIVMIFLLTRGRSRVIFLVTHILLAVSCYFFGSRPPLSSLVAEISKPNQYLDHIQTMLIAGLSVGFVIVFQNRISTREKTKADQATDVLFDHDKLLRVVNQTAQMLLESEMEQLDKTLPRTMELLARCAGAGRMYIWRNRRLEGHLHYVQEYEWLSEEASGNNSLKVKSGYSYIDSIPEWEDKFAAGSHVNGAVRLLSENERKKLEPFGIKSILVIPLFLQEIFWGFVSFDDCRAERNFSEDAVNILRSGSLLLANAIVRSNNESTLNLRLKQQELMSEISQSFISLSPMEALIREALRRMGEFLGVTRILVAVADRETQKSYPVYAWFSEEKWKPDPEKKGFNNIINSTFPGRMPPKGYVPTLFINDIYSEADGRYRVFEKADLKSFIWAPLYVGGNFWGLLSVEECTKKRDWSVSDSQLVATASSAIAGAVARDLMERERTAALEQAVQASQAKGNFLSNMSHEMRTPMNAIIGMTSIGKAAADIERKDYCLEKIEDASTHLLGVINDILDMSKIEANKLELSPVSFDFEKMLQKVVNVINFRVDERQQSFYVTIDKNIPRTLIGDDQRLSQVITNLLSNAVKFTPGGGTIRLNAHLLSEKDDLCTVQIEVSDTGIGISEEQQVRLFNSFEQAESSTTRKFGGTGLGLAISKRIVGMMGGTIRIESKPGKGSTFSFTAVLNRDAKKYRPLLKDGVNWSNVRVLAVDDEPEIVHYFEEIAQRFGIICDVAESGEEALGLLEKNGAYDIYFIDWRMPGMNGMELSRRVKQFNSEKSVVTMISGAEWGIIEDEAKKAGVDKFLAKPLFPSAIADLINGCIGLYTPGPEHERPEEADTFEGCHILLAEDVDINKEIVLALLEPKKVAVDCAGNGAEALRMFSEAPDKYDMIFMDVQMPEMDGYEATRRIRSLDLKKARSIPIVAMTANVFREDIEKALAAGMNDHVGKPLDFDDVLKKLRKYLPANKRQNIPLIKYDETKSADQEARKYGIAWSPDLETGNAEIDSQHKQLFRIANSLASARAGGQGPETLGKTLEFLAGYTVRHFEDEETLQEKYRYPGLEKHRKLHEEFKNTANSLIARFKSEGSSAALSDQVNSAIVRWLVQHIKQEDFKIAEFIRNRENV